MSVDAVFHELGNGLEWIALRERDNPDGIPIVTDLELASVRRLGFAGTLR